MIRADAAEHASSSGRASLDALEREGRVQAFIRLGGASREFDHFSLEHLEQALAD